MKLVTIGGVGAGNFERLIQSLETRGVTNLERMEKPVRRIVTAVQRGGDHALLSARLKFDGIPRNKPLRVSQTKLDRAWREATPEFRAALKLAARNIAKFAKRQMPHEWDISPIAGLKVGQRIRPLASVGCYIPGGRHPLPSSLLMTVIPAQVAGVTRIAVVSPRLTLETLAAAAMLGLNEVYQVGGAHAIAALAYGTATLPKVDKIVGPGNLYVTAAKRMVAFDCSIDMLAGPTEIVVCSESGDPAMIAADLVAQTEHDSETFGVLLTSRLLLAKRVMDEVNEQAKGNNIARRALRDHGYVIVTNTKEEARRIANRLSPEHLTVDEEKDLEWVRHAGSVFVGSWSSQSLGDYVSGPNHTLPTGGAARARGGLSVMDFFKLATVQTYNQSGVRAVGPAAVVLARAEGLTGHAMAIERRLAGA